MLKSLLLLMCLAVPNRSPILPDDRECIEGYWYSYGSYYTVWIKVEGGSLQSYWLFKDADGMFVIQYQGAFLKTETGYVEVYLQYGNLCYSKPWTWQYHDGVMKDQHGAELRRR